jgi:hypothetical protein
VYTINSLRQLSQFDHQKMAVREEDSIKRWVVEDSPTITDRTTGNDESSHLSVGVIDGQCTRAVQRRAIQAPTMFRDGIPLTIGSFYFWTVDGTARVLAEGLAGVSRRPLSTKKEVGYLRGYVRR